MNIIWKKLSNLRAPTLSGRKIIIQGCYAVYVYIYGNHGYFIFFKILATAIFCC